MIPQAELDRALARWKARKAGHESVTPRPESYPQAQAEGSEYEATYVSGAAQVLDAETSSGVVVLGDDDYETGR